MVNSQFHLSFPSQREFLERCEDRRSYRYLVRVNLDLSSASFTDFSLKA